MSLKLKVSLKSNSVHQDELNEYRTHVLSLLEDLNIPDDTSRRLEEAMYQYSEKEYNSRNYRDMNRLILLYKDIARNIVDNLDATNYIGNDYLYKAILSGEVLPEDVPEMSPDKMFPKIWTDYNKKFQQKVLEATKDLESNSVLYKCGKCGNNKTYVEQKQIRSQDEGMTIIITCCISGCGNKWRI